MWLEQRRRLKVQQICEPGRSYESKLPLRLAGGGNLHPQALLRQYAVHNFTPLDRNNRVRIARQLRQLVRHYTGLVQPVKIKVVQHQITGPVLARDGKTGAGDFVVAAHAFGQAAYECCFAAAQVAHQLNNLTALQPTADPGGDLLGFL